MAPSTPEAQRATGDERSGALSRADALPRLPRRGRPPKRSAAALSATSTAEWPDDGRLLLDQQAAMHALGIGRTTLHQLVRTGALTPRYIGPRQPRFLRAELVAFANSLPTRPH